MWLTYAMYVFLASSFLQEGRKIWKRNIPHHHPLLHSYFVNIFGLTCTKQLKKLFLIFHFAIRLERSGCRPRVIPTELYTSGSQCLIRECFFQSSTSPSYFP
jgi:hypothetical protein